MSAGTQLYCITPLTGKPVVPKHVCVGNPSWQCVASDYWVILFRVTQVVWCWVVWKWSNACLSNLKKDVTRKNAFSFSVLQQRLFSLITFVSDVHTYVTNHSLGEQSKEDEVNECIKPTPSPAVSCVEPNAWIDLFFQIVHKLILVTQAMIFF